MVMLACNPPFFTVTIFDLVFLFPRLFRPADLVSHPSVSS